MPFNPVMHTHVTLALPGEYRDNPLDIIQNLLENNKFNQNISWLLYFTSVSHKTGHWHFRKFRLAKRHFLVKNQKKASVHSDRLTKKSVNLRIIS